ncbi:MAG: recombination protein RecR [Myxococcales bacterium]|nr:recombination protein RecR [Myxococcales bacterium]MCB9545552.1 recombination protein RecR [Myxococcales bacterium]
MAEADPIRRLIHAFSRLPGIGEKSAARLAFFVLDAEPHVASELAAALTEVRARIRKCSLCQNLTEQDPCRFCADGRRDAGLICVVENVQGLLAIERTGEFRGRYHVLHGRLSPLDGVGPDQIHIRELLGRLAGVTEIIVATSPSVEGEATALYIQRLAGPLGVRVTRIASGVPIGSELEYADQVTLSRALAGRRDL